ncbi:MAG: adenylate/guanylate cyclase domain-containing protein [Hyphomicrobiales bacterium]|nr:adenylate/guanylate cyclase domain-containing protein [Hyphomicrobiales bacterium]
MTAARRLAAILVADIAGYSRLMGEDEAGTAHAVRERREAAAPLASAFGGRIVKTAGDGMLFEFPSVVAAVECAILIQKMMAERNTTLPEKKRILYRIGVNLGDVLIEGDDILGDGVNVAARLEGVCEAGGVCASGSAYEHVHGRIAADFADLGEQRLKNIAKPVQAYALSPQAVAAAKVEAPGAAGVTAAPPPTVDGREPPRLSIVVLPFANIGGDPEQEYFADGVTDSLTTDLSRLSGAVVIARNTAFTYKGKPTDVKKIGRDLNVRYVLEGSVQRAGNRMRVNVQLVDAEADAHLWAERFDKPVADFFDMQDEILAHLASQLSAELVSAEARRAARASNPDSFDFTLRGMDWLRRGLSSEKYLKEAGACFDRAISLDPENVGALVFKAFADHNYATYFMPDDRGARLAAAEAAAIKALSMAPHNPLAHFALGIVAAATGRLEQGIAECERALTINPNLASAHATIGIYKARLGRAEETESHVEEALRLSPRDASLHLWLGMLGFSKITLGRDDEGALWLRRSIEANRNNPMSHFLLSAALALLGRLDEARAAARSGLVLNPLFTIARLRAAMSERGPNGLYQNERIIDGMRLAGVPEE